MHSISNKRLVSVDICRCIAILLMIETHISSRLLPYPTSLGSLGTLTGAMAAPFFLIISGISYDFFYHSRLRKNFKRNDIFIESFFKGFFVYTLPLIPYFLTHILFPSNNELTFIHWGVFQVIGFGYIFGFFIPRNVAAKLLSITFVFIITFIIHNYYFKTFYFLVTDNFPLFPFIGYFLFGRLSYEIYQKCYLKSSAFILSISFIFFVISFLLFKAIRLDFSSVTSHEITFHQIPIFLILCSIQFLIFFLLVIFVDHKSFVSNLLSPLVNIGKISFSSYYIHHLIIYTIIFVCSFFGYSLTLLPSSMNLIFLLFIILILFYFEKLWHHYDYILGFEWILRKGTYLTIKKFQKCFLIKG